MLSSRAKAAASTHAHKAITAVIQDPYSCFLVLRYLPSILDAVLATLEVSRSPSPSAAALLFRFPTRSFKGMVQQYWKTVYGYWRAGSLERRKTKCACHTAGLPVVIEIIKRARFFLHLSIAHAVTNAIHYIYKIYSGRIN